LTRKEHHASFIRQEYGPLCMQKQRSELFRHEIIQPRN
jgi:hypothetical protein